MGAWKAADTRQTASTMTLFVKSYSMNKVTIVVHQHLELNVQLSELIIMGVFTNYP